MKTSTLITLLSGIATGLLWSGCGKSQPAAVQPQSAPVVQAAPTNSAAEPTPSDPSLVQFSPRSGSKMRIDGSANMIHPHWRVVSDLVSGKLEVGPGFPMEAGQAATPGPIVAKADVFIPVSSLKSVDEDGTHYSDAMDNIMYEKLKADQYTRIYFHLTDMVLKEAAKAKDQPYVFEAKGEVAVAGVTNKITMPVQVLPQADKKLKISGTVIMKMTDFKIEPPAPKLVLGLLKTGNEVTNTFDWIVGPKAAPAAAAAAK